MTGFVQVSLLNLINEIGEDKARKILSDFSCKLNEDIEKFLLESAIPFAKQGFAQTHLIFAQYKGEKRLIAYYAIANKTFIVHEKNIKSKALFKKIKKYGIPAIEGKGYIITAPLIAQLGKNFTDSVNSLISGDELLQIACDKVLEFMRIGGGRIVYLECEDSPKLSEFYEKNGFIQFDKREVDNKSGIESKTGYLLQMFRVMDINFK